MHASLVFVLLVTQLVVAEFNYKEAINTQKNILIFLADDGGLQIGAYGDNMIDTPNLDELAKHGTVFTRAYTSVSRFLFFFLSLFFCFYFVTFVFLIAILREKT